MLNFSVTIPHLTLILKSFLPNACSLPWLYRPTCHREQSCVSPPLEEPPEHNIVGGSAGQKKYTLLCTQPENQGIKEGK